jgi:hypothetical protein
MGTFVKIQSKSVDLFRLEVTLWNHLSELVEHFSYFKMDTIGSFVA